MKNIFTEKVILAIVGAVVTICTPITTYYAIKNSQSTEETKQIAKETIAKVDTLHESVNGKIQLLLDANKTAAHAEGKLEQIAIQDSIEKN